jgi:hypothetical protein
MDVVTLAVVLWALVGLGLATVAYSLLWGSWRLRVETLRVSLPRLPAELAGLRIVHISDTHAKPSRRLRALLDRMVEEVNAANADLVLVTGDIAAGSDNMPMAAGVLARLRARLGVFCCLGNHDVNVTMERWLMGLREGFDVEVLRHQLDEAGVALLDNEHHPLRVRGRTLLLVGVGDVSCGLDDMDAAFEGAAPADLVILLDHTPDILDGPGVERADLVLCGHTHGGQAMLPGVGPVWSPVWRVRLRGEGLLACGDVACHVSRGVGVSWPIRLNCPPQVAILELAQGAPEGRPVPPTLRHTSRAAEPRPAAAGGGEG